MGKKKMLEKLNKKIQNCKKCSLWKTRTNTVSGEGSVDAKIMFLGEAPGREEDRRGLPFCGPAGKFLDELFKNSGIKREKVFITSVLKCRPVVGKHNRPPEAAELKACKIWWQKQVAIIQPKLIVLLGKVAFDTVIGKGEFKKFRSRFLTKNSQQYFTTYHPAAGMRFPKIRKILERDFRTLRRNK